MVSIIVVAGVFSPILMVMLEDVGKGFGVRELEDLVVDCSSCLPVNLCWVNRVCK